MKNFPHQFNRVPKFRAALGVADRIIRRGGDLQDDELYGYALARARVYTFRGLKAPSRHALEARIARERGKAPDNQGPQTAARELRRTLIHLGFLRHDGRRGLRVSGTGRAILTLPEQVVGETRRIWIGAVRNLVLTDEDGMNPIHPAVSMLRLIAARPGVEKKWLAFVLDMNSDSDRELRRVLGLVGHGDFPRALRRAGVSAYKAANAVKIIPALLEQLGLAIIQQGRCQVTQPGAFVLRATGVRAAAAGLLPRAPRQPRRIGRLGYRIRNAEEVPLPNRRTGAARTSEQQAETGLRLNERTRDHQELVRALVSEVNKEAIRAISISDESFDILVETRDDRLLLFEAKTIRADALKQARFAVGQLLYYEFFDVLPRAAGRGSLKIVVFDDEPGHDARAYLAYCGVLCVVFRNGQLMELPANLRRYLHFVD